MCEKMLFASNLVILVAIFVFQTGVSQSVDHPPYEFPADNKTHPLFNIGDAIPTGETPPLRFPDNDPKLIHNETILNELNSRTAIPTSKTAVPSGKTDTEVSDLLQVPLQHNFTLPCSVNSTTVLPSTSQDSQSTEREEMNIKEMDHEDLESDLSKTEDVKLNISKHFLTRSKNHQDHDHSVRSGVLQGQWAAVMAGVFALIAVLGYVGLLTWRRYLEHRYGNREMLINEEDVVNYNDMKNFEI